MAATDVAGLVRTDVAGLVRLDLTCMLSKPLLCDFRLVTFSSFLTVIV